MRLANIENKYILIYRITILLVISIALLITFSFGMFGLVKFSGILSSKNQKEISENNISKPELNKFLEKYEEKEIKAEENIQEEKDVSEKKEADKSDNKNVLFKQQAERLASLQKAFMQEQKKEFADLEFKTLKTEILKLITNQKIPVFCDNNNEELTLNICKDKKIEKRKVRGGVVLFLDVIDISNYSKEFYLTKLNYFELQYSFVEKFLTNKAIGKLYSEGRILSPTIESITEFHTQFIDNNKKFWKTRNENIKLLKQNKQNLELQKLKDKAESLQILMIAGVAFCIFILVMFFVIFYRIERNLNEISQLNMNMMNNMKN